MMVCDLCGTPGRGTIVGPEQMRRAVFDKGFDPFALGLSKKTGYPQHGIGAYGYWVTNMVAPDTTNWNICSKCMAHLKDYLDEPPKADGFAGLQFVRPTAARAIREEVEKKYQKATAVEATPRPAAQPSVSLSIAPEYAGFWRRAVAWVLDMLVLGIAAGLVSGLIGGLIGASISSADEQTLSRVVVLIVSWLYYALMESSSWQATLGKRALGITVTDLQGNRISFGRATGRHWAKVLSGLILGIGYLMAGFTERKQALHDQVANCLVAKKGKGGSVEPTEEAKAPTTPATDSGKTEWKTCSRCGESNPASSWHCAVCGARLVEGSAPALAPEKREEQQKVEPRLPQGIPRWPPAVALLNLTGLGLGYLYLHQWQRWLVHFLLTISLIVIAFAVNTARAPLLWLTIFGLWLLWMAFDGWWQARRLGQTGPIEPTGRSWLPVAVAILLIGLEIAGFWFYTALGQQEFGAGIVAYGLTDCQTALPYFNRVTTWYRLTLDPNLITAEAKNAECKLLAKAEDRRKQNELAEAITAYETYLNTYPNAALALPVKIATAETYAEWATSLRETDNYGEAIKKYETILNNYPDTPLAMQMNAAIAETYGEWAVHSREKDDYPAALKKYETILKQYPDTPIGQQADSLIPETYYAWGQYLVSQNEYLEALEKLVQIEQLTPEPDILARVEQEFQNTLQALSQDTGQDGQKVLKETWPVVCNGKPATSAAIGLAEDESGKALFNGSEFSIPDNLTAIKPAHLQYVVCLKKATKTVEKCPYGLFGITHSHDLIRQQQLWHVSVRDPHTGQVIVKKTFEGATPRQCPGRWDFGSKKTDYITGTAPSAGPVIDWLRGVVH